MQSEKPIIIVFRTTIKSESDIKHITQYLNNHEGITDWSVDLEDWENILRIEAKDGIEIKKLIQHIHALGYNCEELED